MAFDIEGRLYIEQVDFWIWVSRILDMKEVDQLENSFEISGYDIVFSYRNSDEKEYIDLASLWEFIREYVPVKDAEYEFGVPAMDNLRYDFIVDFAACSYCHPSQWKNPPTTISDQWKNIRS